MEIQGSKEGGIFVFSVSGSLNSDNVEIVQSLFDEWINCGETKLIGDMSGLKYISSAGLRCFLYAAKTLMGGRKGFVLYNLQENILDILHLIGMINVINVAGDKEDAVKKIG